jgi:hypothetical protein
MKGYMQVVPFVAAAVDLIIVTLIVAWALEDVVYFSLFVGFPVGIVSSVVTYLALKKFFGAGVDKTSP